MTPQKWVLIIASLIMLAVISCSTVNRTLLAPPQIPGAVFTGSDTCGACHTEIVRDFSGATHANLVAEGKHALNMGCESCHGPGSLHVESGGALGTIINPKKSPEACFSCHLNTHAEFNLPHHHPVIEGKVSCTDCHNPHKGPAHRGGGTQVTSQNETCFNCHISQRGPHIFEHEAIREGCTTCHKPHGSVNNKLLTERNGNLCLKCHFQQQTTGGQILIGGFNHTGFLSRGTCWTAGCHEAVHGSQVSSSLRF